MIPVTGARLHQLVCHEPGVVMLWCLAGVTCHATLYCGIVTLTIIYDNQALILILMSATVPGMVTHTLAWWVESRLAPNKYFMTWIFSKSSLYQTGKGSMMCCFKFSGIDMNLSQVWMNLGDPWHSASWLGHDTLIPRHRAQELLIEAN